MDLKVVLKGTEGTEDELIFAPFLEGKDRETLIDVVADLRANGRGGVCFERFRTTVKPLHSHAVAEG